MKKNTHKIQKITYLKEKTICLNTIISQVISIIELQIRRKKGI